MSLLSSILPGLRAFRAPFAAGVITLLAGWIVAEPHVRHGNASAGIYESLAHLEDLIGRGGETAALAFAAYLLGSLVVTLAESTARLTLRAGLFQRLLAGWYEETAKGLLDTVEDPSEKRRLSAHLDDLYVELPRRPSTFRGAARYVLGRGGVPTGSTRRSRVRWICTLSGVQQEWRMIQFQLLAKEPVLASEVDRLESEAEFRRALFLPLSLLAIAIAVQHGSPGLALLTAALAALTLRASIFATVAAEQATADLVLSGVVELPLLAALKRGQPARG